MRKYTYDDINIIDNERVSDAFGKECYYGYNVQEVLDNALNDKCKFILRWVDGDGPKPFGDIQGNWYPFMIIKKEDPKPKSEYVPFDIIEEFVKASLIHNKDHYLAGTGIWVKELYDDDDAPVCTTMVNSLCMSDNTIFVDGIWLSLKEVLNSYTFLDGTPCGKQAE